MISTQPDVLAVPLTAGQGGTHLFVVPGMDGQLAPFRQLDGELADIAVSGLVLASAPPPGTSLSDLATAYLAGIESARESDTVVVAGFSFGAYVATEMAHLAAAAGRPFHDLVVIDTVPQPGPQAHPGRVTGHWYVGRTHGLALSWEEFSALSREEQVDAVCRHWPQAPGQAQTRAFVEHVFATIEVHFAALYGHVMRPYHGDVSVIAAWDGDGAEPSPQLWLPAYPDGVALEIIPGTHVEIAAGTRCAELARALGRLTSRAR